MLRSPGCARWPQVDVAPPGALATAVAEVRAVLGAAAAGAGVAAGAPAGARGAVDLPLVDAEAQAWSQPLVHIPGAFLSGLGLISALKGASSPP